MSQRNGPGRNRERRGAQGRRRRSFDVSRSVAVLRNRRRRLGRLALGLGLTIFMLSFGFTVLNDRGSDEPSGAAVLQDDAERGIYHPEPEQLTPVQVEAVIDGDTLDVSAAATQLRVRIFGIDTPERGERCYAEATERLRVLAGAEVRLLADERQRDDFGRELRYVFTTDGRSIDAAMLDEGLAEAWRGDGALRDALVAIEDEARAAGRGCLWDETP